MTEFVLIPNVTVAISDSQAQTKTPYIYSGFDDKFWRLGNGNFPSIKPLNEISLYIIPNNSTLLVPMDALSSATYTASTFDMERVWAITEGVSFPRLIFRAPRTLGIGLTHNMTYTYVVPHIKGTMNYKGVTWKSRGAFFTFPNPPATGSVGQEITYSIPESDYFQTITRGDEVGIDVEWFASGIRDVEGAGGFGSYNNQNRRTVKIMNNASATVNFYFTQPQWIPRTNYKANVSTPDGIIELSVAYQSQSAIKFSVTPEIQLGFPIVDLKSDNATQIRVMMPNGIKALQAWVPYKQIEMLED